MHIVASIQARLGSTRLPGKVLLHLGDHRLLQWSINRSKGADRVDETIVTTGDQPENDAVREYCERSGITHVTGPEKNLLARHRAVANRTNCDLLVRITADCPFVSSTEINRVVEVHQTNEAWYTTNNTDEMPIGTAVDVIDKPILDKLYEIGDTHPVRRLRNNPEEWNIAITPNEKWTEYSGTHIAVDTPDDYWTLSDAIEAVGGDPLAVAGWVANR